MPSSLLKAPPRLGRMPTLITRKDGVVLAVNKKRLLETPFMLQTNAPNNQVTMSASSTSATTPMRVSAQGPMQISELGVQRSAVCTVKMFIMDGASPRALMNAPCHIDAIFGAGGNMYPLPEALYIDETRALSIAYTDLSAGSNNARAAFSCAKYGALREDPSLQRIKQRLSNKEYLSMLYFLTLDQQSIALTALQNTSVIIQIPQDLNFELHQISFVSTGNFSFNLTNAESGESLVNAPSNTSYMIPHLLGAGNNQHPYRLSEPWMIFGGQTLQLSLADTSVASNTVFMVFCGTRVSPRQWS